MRKLTIAVLALTMTFTVAPLNAQKTKVKTVQTQTKDNGLDLQNMDLKIKPQQDFYDFVNGGWMKTAKIPGDQSRWGVFGELAEKVEQQSKSILDQILATHYTDNSEGQKIKALYTTYTDWNKRNALGITPIQPELAQIDAINNLNDFKNYLTEKTKDGHNPFYDWNASANLKDSKMNAIYLGGPSLGLGIDYYQKESDANTNTLNRYREYVSTLMGIIGDTNPDATATNLVNFEKTMAKTLLTNVERRDANKRYNPENMAQLKALVTNVDLPSYLQAVGVNTDMVIVGELNYYKKLDSFINENNLPLLKKYLKYRVIASNASNLDQKLDDLQFDFYGKFMTGQKEQKSMEKRGLSFVNRNVGEAFGKLYVAKYFPPEAKAEMLTLVGYIQRSLADRIKNLTWMTEPTKVKALEKLSKFTVKIGYPDKWRDYSGLDLKTVNQGGTLFDNLQAISKWHYQETLDKVGKPVDRSRWGMTPQTVNAYYSPTSNEIVFPAAILQPPFFNVKADPAINFGGIGAVIGHEISHGFDDSGSRFDGDGNLENWWTPTDRQRFDALTSRLAAQYDKYEPVKGSFVNGKFTLGENIGDLGGVNIAYEALQMYLKDHGNPGKISGFTQDQRFFISWATVWRTLATPQALAAQVKTDPHAPGYFRSFAPLLNMDQFFKAFHIKPGDKMWNPPADRIHIW